MKACVIDSWLKLHDRQDQSGLDRVCEPARQWFREQLAAGKTVEEMWAALLTMRATKEELAAERALAQEGETVSKERHTGMSWLAWLVRRVGLRCNTGSYSGRPKTHDGPNLEQIKVEDVYFALEQRVYGNMR